MTISPNYKAIAQGVLVYVVGYGFCAVTTTARANLSDWPYPRWIWPISFALIFVPLLAGARAAHIAATHPKVHGAAVGIIGTIATLLILVLLMGVPIPPSAMAAGLVVATLLAWLGAILLAFARPRRGL